MANIDKELNQIKNAVYGREVRGSIHDGIDKINKETEIATGKADEAHDVMESIINDGFDNAALESNFEQKLDDEINNLQPEWTQFKEQTNQQLAETDEQNFVNRPVSRYAERPPMITIHDDDGDLGFYTKLYPLAQEYNIPIVSALVTGYRRGFPGDDRTPNPANCNYEQIMEMHASGLVEFVSHTHNHILYLTEESRETIRYELKESRDFLKRYGFNHRVVVFPGGHINEKVLEETRQIYEYSTTYGGANLIGTPPFSNYKIPRASLQRPFEEIKTQIDEAIEKNAWIILRVHVDQWEGYSEQHMRQVIEYALNQGMEFVTTEEGIKHHANILEISDTDVISAEGNVHGNKLGRVQHTPREDGVDFSTPLSFFDENKHSYTEINTPNASSFPRGLNGELDTYNRFIRPYARQIYTTSRDFLEFFRGFGNDVEGEWDKFIQKDFIRYHEPNGLSIDENPLGRKVRYLISYCHIYGSNSENFPEGKNGLYVINALRTASMNPTREYHIYQSSKVYKSYWNNVESKWTEFKLEPSYLGSFSRVDQSVTVLPKRTEKIYLESPQIKKRHVFNISTSEPLPNRLLMDYYMPQDGRIEIRFHNISDESISFVSIDFTANIIEV